ncbi:MAG: DMT family transporter [Rhizobiales bacterium]|nr:DMT family transporter [Hyphomicrobiales bacterium]
MDHLRSAMLRRSRGNASLRAMFALSFGLAAALCWSVHDCLARFHAGRVGPFRMAFLVCLVGAALVLPFVLWRGVIWQAPAWALGYALALGCVYALALGGLFKAFSLAPVAIVGPMTAGYPALVVLWGLIHGLVPTPVEWLGVALVITGAVIVGASSGDTPDTKPRAPHAVLHAALAMVAANIGFAAAVILGQTAAVAMGEVETTFISRFPAALLLLPLSFRDARMQARISMKGLIGIFFMAALDASAVTAVNAAGHFPEKEFAAMGISAYGGLSVLVAMIFLGEKVSRGQWFGIFLVATGIAALGWPKE